MSTKLRVLISFTFLVGLALFAGQSLAFSDVTFQATNFNCITNGGFDVEITARFETDDGGGQDTIRVVVQNSSGGTIWNAVYSFPVSADPIRRVVFIDGAALLSNPYTVILYDTNGSGGGQQERFRSQVNSPCSPPPSNSSGSSSSGSSGSTTTNSGVGTGFQDGRVDPQPGDRVVVYCRSTVVEAVGINDQSQGVFLANFTYSELVGAGGNGVTKAAAAGGTVIARVNTSNNSVFVAWSGGPFNASGTGDFDKTVTCALPAVIVQPGAPTVGTPLPGVPAQPGVFPPTAGSAYVVQPGDTLRIIANRFGTTIDAIVAANGIVNINVIYPGQVLVIPGRGSTLAPSNPITPTNPGGARVYVVQPGDNLFRIALRYGTTVNALAAANGITDVTRIYVGQTLIIP